ncbi:MAG TPA: hypothetical protein VJZ75_10590 [Candidatus Bathyarchaeia archaeon]|nr:hypothetical protein [Candidatus Bathyarchaeia archaeon]
MRIISILLILVIVPGLTSTSVASQSFTTVTNSLSSTSTQLSTISIGMSTLSALTTSASNVASGTIPAALISSVTGVSVCYYFPYLLHVDASIKAIIGTISASSPVNLYIMSKSQYDQFVAYNPPCGSSYVSLLTEYSTKSYSLQWTPPQPDDYYIMLQNTSQSTITYTVQVSTIQNQSITIYSTSMLLQTAILLLTQVDTLKTSSTVSNWTPSNDAVPILIGIASIAVIILLIRSRRNKMRKDEETHMYAL